MPLVPCLPFLVHLPLLLYWAWLLRRTQAQEPLRRWFWAGLMLKWLSGIALGLLYLHHYPYRGDTFALFDESATLSQLAFRQPGDYLKILFFDDFNKTSPDVFLLRHQPRAFFTAKLLSCLNLFTFHNYWITGLYCSLFSFIGFWRLANMLVRNYPNTRTAAITAFLLFPSVVFWSSGVLKESLAMTCLTSLLVILLPLYFSAARISDKNEIILNERKSFGFLGRNWQNILCVIFFGWIIWQLKFYYFGILFAAGFSLVASLFVSVKYDYSNGRVLSFLQILFFCVVLGAVPLLIEKITGQSLLVSIVANHDATVSISGPSGYVVFDSLSPTARSFAAYFPLALWSGLFAPLPWQTHHWLVFGASVENVVLVLLSIACLIKSIAPAMRRTPKRQAGLAFLEDTVLTRLLVQAAWLYILSLATVLAFASPNFGALARYKVGFLPFLVYVLVSGAFGKQPQVTVKGR